MKKLTVMMLAVLLVCGMAVSCAAPGTAHRKPLRDPLLPLSRPNRRRRRSSLIRQAQ